MQFSVKQGSWNSIQYFEVSVWKFKFVLCHWKVTADVQQPIQLSQFNSCLLSFPSANRLGGCASVYMGGLSSDKHHGVHTSFPIKLKGKIFSWGKRGWYGQFLRMALSKDEGVLKILKLLFRTRIILYHLSSGNLPSTASSGLICSVSSAVLGWSLSWMKRS